MNAAEDNDVRPGFGRLLRQARRVAHKIGDVLNFGHLVVMGENDSVKLLFEREDLTRKRAKLRAGHRCAQRQTVRSWKQNLSGLSHPSKVKASAARRQCAPVVWRWAYSPALADTTSFLKGGRFSGVLS